MERPLKDVREDAFRPPAEDASVPEEQLTREEIVTLVKERPSRRGPPYGPKPGRETPGGWRH